jgi:protease-4
MNNWKFEERFLAGTRTSGLQIAVIKVNGEINDQQDSYYQKSMADEVIAQLKQAEKEPETRGIILKIDSPGGNIIAVQKIYDELEKARKQKPIVALLENVAASGGYYLACGTDKIVAHPLTITGDIGAIMFLPDVETLFEKKLGVQMRVIESGRHKDMGSPWRSLDKEEKEILQRFVDSGGHQFQAVVIKNRNLNPQETKLISDGRIFSGEDAINDGLVDELGTLDTATEIIKKITGLKEFKVVEYYTRPLNLFQLFLGGAGGRLSLPAIPVISIPNAGLQYLWVPGKEIYGK